MEFQQPLDVLLSTQTGSTASFEYYRKTVLCELLGAINEKRKGELIGVSCRGAVTFNFGDNEHHDYHIKAIQDIKLLQQDTDDMKSAVSIKDKINDIVSYKVVQHLIYRLRSVKHSSAAILEPLSIENRKQYLKTYTDPAKKIEIAQKILQMPVIKLTDVKGVHAIQSHCEWSSKTDNYTDNDLLSLLNAFRVLWINYVKQNGDHSMELDVDRKVDEKKTYASYMQWDNWSIDGTAAKVSTVANPKAQDIYLKHLWPHCFHGPYYKVLNSSQNREWKCKKCNKSPAGKVTEWYKVNGVISTKCNICGNLCDPSCGLKRGADLKQCTMAGSDGRCKVCTHLVDDHAQIGWKCREVVSDNAVTEKGRVKYYKTKRTVLTFEICHSCIESAKKSQDKKETKRVDKLKEKRKERRKNVGKKVQTKVVSPQNRAPVMEFMDIMIDAKVNIPSRPAVAQKKPVISKPRVVLTQQMKNDVSVRAALCFIPPQKLWSSIQAIREAHDPAYKRWMPHLNIFFPFVDEKYFEDIGRYIEEEIVKRNNISAFDIELNTFDVFDRVKQKLSGRSSKMTKVETMFLKPSGCTDAMQEIFECLRYDWSVCANKHGGGFSPHLTVGKFKMNEMMSYKQKFQANWKSLSWKCDALYLISRRGKDPFEIRYTIPLC